MIRENRLTALALCAVSFFLIATQLHAAPPPFHAGMVEFSASQNLTGSAPASATDGIALRGIVGYRLSVCATSTNTLSGAGTVLAYVYVPTQGAWARNPSLDFTMSASSVKCQLFPDIISYIHWGQLKYVPSGVTVSGGTTVSTLIEAVSG